MLFITFIYLHYQGFRGNATQTLLGHKPDSALFSVPFDNNPAERDLHSHNEVWQRSIIPTLTGQAKAVFTMFP